MFSHQLPWSWSILGFMEQNNDCKNTGKVHLEQLKLFIYFKNTDHFWWLSKVKVQLRYFGMTLNRPFMLEGPCAKKSWRKFLHIDVKDLLSVITTAVITAVLAAKDGTAVIRFFTSGQVGLDGFSPPLINEITIWKLQISHYSDYLCQILKSVWWALQISRKNPERVQIRPHSTFIFIFNHKC